MSTKQKPFPVSHVWSLVCSNFTNDTQTNNLSLFNLIEKITAGILEADLERAKEEKRDGLLIPMQFSVVSRFTRKDAADRIDFEYRASFVTPLGKSLMATERAVHIDAGIRNLRVGSTFDRLPVDISGDAKILIEVRPEGADDYIEVGTVPVEIEIQPSAAAPQSA